MNSPSIPEAAVRVTAKWLHDIDCRSAAHSGHPADFECYDWLDEARELLEVAAPFIAAAALEDAADQADDQELASITPGALRRRAKSYRTAE